MRILTIVEARDFLEVELGRKLTKRQVKRAAEDRRLPFFIDPINGNLVIDADELQLIYQKRNGSAKRKSPGSKSRILGPIPANQS